MMKKYLLLISLLCSQSFSQVKYDTLQAIQVTRAVKYFKVSVQSVPWSINILQIDLTDPHIKVESVKAKNNIRGNEPTSLMSGNNSFKGHRVIAAVNGDFYFKGGIPTNLQIKNGQMLTAPIARSIVGFNESNKPMMDIVSFSGSVVFDKSTYKLDGINTSRKKDQTLFINRYFGESTGTNSNGREFLIKRIDKWVVNDTVRCVVKKIEIGIGNMTIPDTSFAVISTEGSVPTFTRKIKIGDTLKIVQFISPALPRMNEAIGGFIQVVKDGKDYVDWSYIKENKPQHALLRHPRTGIGFSQDSTKLFLFAVDGRQKQSAGMTLHELADLMINASVYHGLNLDGGGSTTMVVQDSVVNSPSDGIERAVANGLLIISTDPKDELDQSYFKNEKNAVFDKP